MIEKVIQVPSFKLERPQFNPYRPCVVPMSMDVREVHLQVPMRVTLFTLLTVSNRDTERCLDFHESLIGFPLDPNSDTTWAVGKVGRCVVPMSMEV